MTKLEEYLKMGFKGFRNLDNVTKGFYNSLLDKIGKLPVNQKQEAEKRLKICTECPFMTRNAVESGIYTTAIKEERCSICGCYTEKKAMSFSDYCPLSELALKVITDDNGKLITKQLWLLDTEYATKDFVTNNDKYLQEIEALSTGSVEMTFMGEKYLKLTIPRKFDKVNFEKPQSISNVHVTDINTEQ